MLIRMTCMAGAAVLMVLVVDGTAAAQGSSGPLAEQLATALDGAQVDSIAAKDTEGDDRYVAALFFPGRLLVVSARYEVPLYADEKIATQKYRDLYIDLNTAFIAGTKILITDGGADGLRVDDPADSADTGGQLVRFGGDWSGQQLSEAEYTTLFSEADASYARMLRALLAELN